MHQSLAELAILQIQQGVCQSKSFCQWSVAGIKVELVLMVPIIVEKKSLLAPTLSEYILYNLTMRVDIDIHTKLQ
jgi:hypothetical protein